MHSELAIKWLKQAKHDLELAEKNIAIEGYDVAAFLSQQAVEKLLKSVFVVKGEKIPKTHYCYFPDYFRPDSRVFFV